MADNTLKGLTSSTDTFSGEGLRIGIVHTRWNKQVVDALVAGALGKLRERGVKQENVVVQEVPGSYELPFACSRMIAASQLQASSAAPDLMDSTALLSLAGPAPVAQTGASTSTLDAIIAIGVLIKGSTMHFEYICDATSQALMKLQMDTGVPVIFGVLTCLNDEQALARAGLGEGQKHNHGGDWGLAAVEMGAKNRLWGQGKFH
ncbi:6-7-dimethyl-8-ribityllumazine synthase [Dacryopinax primogenitus]|uniref:6,7-dimethyl-8-ribityllumazine synthase n=1 Tax=Dacryopinax primogenitus (strain DJM 731) TaxID=1858805 RepID=M5GA75_DACPD|nr:6-7-dimethyl-8-ribityllumazine synthase [Dacryopinax primogenitus]EJU00783.1 6-7-dimethyl-8-ribityllumazine synthase [Dacryopinax primogenitus]